MKESVFIFFLIICHSKINAQLGLPECLLNQESWKNCSCNSWKNYDTTEVKLIELTSHHGGGNSKDLLIRIEIAPQFNALGELIFVSVGFSNERREYFLYCLGDLNYVVGKRWKKTGKVISESRDNFYNADKKFIKMWNELVTIATSYCE